MAITGVLSGLGLALCLAAAPPPAPGAPGAPAAPPAEPVFKATYAYSLSTNFGVIPFSDVVLAYDPLHHELFAVSEGQVHVFNESGMEVYAFGDDPEVGGISAVAPMESGDLLAAAYRNGDRALVRLNFRGEFIEQLQLRDVPPEYEAAVHGALRYRDGRIYLADTAGMRIAVLDATGQFMTGFDVAEKLDMGEKREALGIRGFNVDRQGNMLFTIQPLFSAFVLSLDGQLKGFGVKGSAPGKFNVVSGIARGDDGTFYVADILKSAVLAFSENFVFLKEFGYRTRSAGGLSAPDDLAAGDGKLFIVNHARRGVSVFQVSRE